MTDQNPRLNMGWLVLAGMGAGALTGAVIGALALRRPHRQASDRQASDRQASEEISETVDDLKRRAELILTELSRSHAPDSGE